MRATSSSAAAPTAVASAHVRTLQPLTLHRWLESTLRKLTYSPYPETRIRCDIAEDHLVLSNTEHLNASPHKVLNPRDVTQSRLHADPGPTYVCGDNMSRWWSTTISTSPDWLGRTVRTSFHRRRIRHRMCWRHLDKDAAHMAGPQVPMSGQEAHGDRVGVCPAAHAQNGDVSGAGPELCICMCVRGGASKHTPCSPPHQHSAKYLLETHSK